MTATTRAAAARPSVLVFTTVFPNGDQPLHGVFVQERLRHLAPLADLQVVAPIPRLPWRHRGVPRQEVVAGLPVLRPTFHYVRGILKGLDGACLFLSALATVRRARKGFDFDLIDAHFAYPDGLAAVLLGRLFGRPVTITERGTLATFPRGTLRRRLADWALRRADRVIAVAQPLADLALEAGVPAARVSVIENGVDAGRFALRDRAEARRRLGVPEGVHLMVSVGHLSRRKGFHRVLAAMPALLPHVPDLRLTIVGGPGAEGNIGPQLARMTAELGLGDRVTLAGPRPPEEVALWLAAADLFVLASDHEGCPNVVWEALACGRPVVATRVGHIERMVPEFAGILAADPDDAGDLARCLAEALARDWEEGRIRAHAERHGWDDVARRVLGEWLEVMGRPTSVAHAGTVEAHGR
jgi:glycosyltransferase involved in cell wall biosynthesis